MDTAPLPLDPAPAERTALTLSWKHPAGLIGLSLVNLALRILTLGVYGFWAKTEVRKRLWSGVRLNGEPLVYTGTGKELMLGFLVIFGAVLLPAFLAMLAAFIAFGPESRAADISEACLYLVFLGLWGLAIYRAQRYRLSRTLWRGIRGSLSGDGKTYAWTFFWTALLIPLTLGWIIPWRSTRLQTLIVNDMRFGNARFRFEASARPLYKRFAIVWVILAALAGLAFHIVAQVAAAMVMQDAGLEERLANARLFQALLLSIAVLGYLAYLIAGAWYRAHQTNYFAAHTRFDEAALRANLTPGGLMAVSVTSFLILVLSIGILAPVAQARIWRYMIERMGIDGEVALADIAQGTDTGPLRGEGLAQAFDFEAV